jgi:translation initiation factor 3 subunit F
MEVKVDVGHHKTMLELHQRVYPKHTVVGWFSTGMSAGIADGIIHQFYSTGQQSGCGIPVPMYVVVDTSLAPSDRVSIKAYVCKLLSLGGSPVAREFVEVPTQIQTSGGEGLALSALHAEKMDSMPTDVQNFRQSVQKLQKLIAQAHAYVKDVVEGKTPADVTIGRCERLTCSLGCKCTSMHVCMVHPQVTCVAGISRTSLVLYHATIRQSLRNCSTDAHKIFFWSFTCLH